MDYNQIAQNVLNTAIHVGLKLVAAVAIYAVGRYLIGVVTRMLQRWLEAERVDPTILRYLGSIVTVVLNIALALAILGYFGVETTSFAALFAAAGIAIGAAWSGLLSNFAGGAFLVILRPYKVGDLISAGGVTGTVWEIGLFATTIVTPDNVQTYVGNGKILSENIQNYSVNPYRRAELSTQLDYSVNPGEAIRLLEEGLSKIPNVLSEPAPEVEIEKFTLAGPVLAVKPCCPPRHYEQVCADTNRMICETFSRAGYPAPRQHYLLRGDAAATSSDALKSRAAAGGADERGGRIPDALVREG